MRYRELDIARGFTVLMMPAVHVTMLYGNEAVYHSWWGGLLNWVATMPGAQLFMLLMGMSFSFSSATTPRAMISKSGRWFVLSYALNFLKFIVPAIAGWLPSSFYAALQLQPGTFGTYRLFLIGDILQLAAISQGAIYLISWFKASNKYIIGLILLVANASPVLWRFHISNSLYNEFFSLATGNDHLVFFPVFPWLAFPLMGLIIGIQLKKGKLNYLLLSITGAVLMLPQIIMHGFHFTLEENLYRPAPVQVSYHLGFCFVWLAICKVIAAALKDFSSLGLLDFCSKHITRIYCIQWIIIFWCIAIIPYRGLAITATILVSFLLSCVVFLLTYLFSKKHNPLLNQQHYGRINHL